MKFGQTFSVSFRIFSKVNLNSEKSLAMATETSNSDIFLNPQIIKLAGDMGANNTSISPLNYLQGHSKLVVNNPISCIIQDC